MSNSSRKSLLAQVDKRWLGAGLAAAGAVAADKANAAIVYTAPPGGVNVPSTFAGIYLNMENGLTGGSQAATPGWDINPYGITYLNHFTPAGGGTKGTTTSYFNLPVGNQICPTDVYDTGTSITNDAAFPNNLNSSNNIYGVRLVLADTTVHLGWFRMQLGGDGGAQPRNIIEWAYESAPNTCIAAGATPEPGSLALLAAGGLGLIARRRRHS